MEESNLGVTVPTLSMLPIGKPSWVFSLLGQLKQSCPYLGNKMQGDAAQQDAAGKWFAWGHLELVGGLFNPVKL